jgi:hypothetical protein
MFVVYAAIDHQLHWTTMTDVDDILWVPIDCCFLFLSPRRHRLSVHHQLQQLDPELSF